MENESPTYSTDEPTYITENHGITAGDNATIFTGNTIGDNAEVKINSDNTNIQIDSSAIYAFFSSLMSIFRGRFPSYAGSCENGNQASVEDLEKPEPVHEEDSQTCDMTEKVQEHEGWSLSGTIVESAEKVSEAAKTVFDAVTSLNPLNVASEFFEKSDEKQDSKDSSRDSQHNSNEAQTMSQNAWKDADRAASQVDHGGADTQHGAEMA